MPLLVSNMITVHRDERFIGEAVPGALGQTHTDDGLMVVVDGLVDGTLKRVPRFGRKVSLMRIPNRGVVGSRNTRVFLLEAG
jgi:glycosyltransferase involved in cell wall biosynthesis